MGVSYQQDLGTGNGGHQVLKPAGSHDGMTAFQLPCTGVQEGFAAGCQEKTVGLHQLETGLGSQGLQSGIGLCLLCSHQGYQRAAVMQRNSHGTTAQRGEILHESGIIGRQQPLQETGGIGHEAGGAVASVKHHHGGSVRGNGAQNVPGCCQMLFCGSGFGGLVQPDDGQRDTGQQQSQNCNSHYGSPFSHIVQRYR